MPYSEPPIEPDRILYSVPEAARLMSIGRSTLYQLMANGELPSVKIGTRRLVARNSIDAYVERMCETSSTRLW